MSFFDILILDTILILFPVICTLIIKAHSLNNGYKIEKGLLIDIANLSSLFFLIKYCDTSNSYMILLANMPFIISVINNRKCTSTIIAIILVLFNVITGTNIIFTVGEYFLYLVVFYFLQNYKTVLIIFVFIKGIFLTINEYYVLSNNNITTIIEIFLCLTTFYLLGSIVINIIEMIDKIVTINQSLKELEKEKNLKNSLFKITHEIKNPISVCKGYLQMMDYNDMNKVKKYNQIIESELNRTLDIMDNFSEYTKININTDLMDLNCLITETINSMSLLFKSNNIKVNYNESEEMLIEGDYDRLKQVLINILKNSTEAIEKEGIIDINVKPYKKSVVISIKDNGKGISAEELEKISELFYTSKEKGCGIGVSLSKEIISLHKGTLKYDSVLGEYTKAIIKLPRTLHKQV